MPAFVVGKSVQAGLGSGMLTARCSSSSVLQATQPTVFCSIEQENQPLQGKDLDRCQTTQKQELQHASDAALWLSWYFEMTLD